MRAAELRDHCLAFPGSHWNTLIIDGSLPDEMIRDMVEDSYDLVVSGLSRTRRRALGWHADERCEAT
jgi:predicted DNA-binding protein (MmcQ/YjbR family)